MTWEIDWIEVPAGEVAMGTPEAEVDAVHARCAGLPVERSWFLKECPRRAVAVPAFRISRNLVTVETVAAAARELGLGWTPNGSPDHPAAVTHAEALACCVWLADRTGLAVRLPAEVEWERAARGDDAREFPWGDLWEPGRANIGEGSRGTTVPAGSLPAGASPFGVLDMAGNLDEWTATVYAPYPGAPAAVPAVEDWALDPHVTRGGGWNDGRDAARCARRHGLYSPGPVGFRVAVS